MRYLFLAYLIINPLFYMKNMEFRPAQELCFQISSIILIISSLFFNNKAIKKDKFNIALGILGLVFVLNYLILSTGWSILFNLFLGLTLYFTAIKTLDKDDFHLLLKGFLGVFVFSLIYQFGQMHGFDIRGQGTLLNGGKGIVLENTPDCSIWGLKASMGIYYAIVIALALPFSWALQQEFKKNWKGVLIVLLSLLFIGLYFVPLATSYSTGAYLAGVAAMMLIFWFRKRILFWLALLPLILGLTFFIVKMDSPMGMMTSRFPMWGMVLQDIHKQPVFGYGLDSFRQPETKMETHKQIVRYYKNSFDDTTKRVVKDVVVKDFEVMDWRVLGVISGDEKVKVDERLAENKNIFDFWDNCHNIYLYIAYETGYLGFGVFIAIICLMIKRFKRSKRGNIETACFAAIITILVSGLTQFPLNLARIAHTLPILGALFYLATEEKYEVTA